MEWYKHRTGSHDDPDISDAWDELGDFGYVGFFVILEIYGQEFRHRNSEDFIEISTTFLRRKLRKSLGKVTLLLNFYKKRERILSKIDGNRILIKIPNFIGLADNWTSRGLRSSSVVAPFPSREQEEEQEVEEEKEMEVLHTSCGELSKNIASPQEIIFVELPLNDKTKFKVTESFIKEKIELYPAVDIKQEFRNMKDWLDSNPTRRKTRNGIKSFITKWLSRKQDKGTTLRVTNESELEKWRKENAV